MRNDPSIVIRSSSQDARRIANVSVMSYLSLHAQDVRIIPSCFERMPAFQQHAFLADPSSPHDLLDSNFPPKRLTAVVCCCHSTSGKFCPTFYLTPLLSFLASLRCRSADHRRHKVFQVFLRDEPERPGGRLMSLRVREESTITPRAHGRMSHTQTQRRFR